MLPIFIIVLILALSAFGQYKFNKISPTTDHAKHGAKIENRKA